MSNLFLPKHEVLMPKQEIFVPSRLGGFFKMEAVRPDGRRRLLADWFPNLITDRGLNQIAYGGYMNACHVGTSNTAPNVLDTILAGYVGGTTTIQAGSYGAQATPPYYGWKRLTYRFNVGVATGNLAEVGIATRAANGGSTVLFSRALILDGGGAPTSITVLADEVLDVTYELRNYPPLTDVLQTVTITGSGTHDLVTRAAFVTGTGWSYSLGSAASFNTSGVDGFVFNGSIGAITSGPGGSHYNVSQYNVGSYVDNSLERSGGFGFGLNQGNLAGGITASRFQTTLGYYQTSYAPFINKDATKTISFVFKTNWARNV
jgi:hypothetical protein